MHLTILTPIARKLVITMFLLVLKLDGFRWQVIELVILTLYF